MTPLLALDDRHPFATGALGVASGVSSWLLHNLHAVAGVVSDLGMIAASSTAILIFAIKLNKHLREWRRERAWQREMNRHHRARDPDDHLP